MPKASALLTLVLLLTCGLASPQSASPQNASSKDAPLSASEAYKSAIAPYTATRAQANDLTDADALALKIGMAQASRDCLSLIANPKAQEPKELLALGQLCLFGQQFEPARSTLVMYLSTPQPADREQGLLLLIRALLGLDEPGAAEPHLHSLMRDYPYDPAIHFAIDQVIDALEGSSEAFDKLALQLCATENAQTLPLLHSGKPLVAKNESVAPSTLFADATRCASIERSFGDISAPDTIQQLTAIVAQPEWRATAELAPMRAALARETMVGQAPPIDALQAQVLGPTNKLTTRTLSLMHGTVLLVPFVLWSPSASDVVGTLARSAPGQTIYAVTSWSANSGQSDTPSPATLAGLRAWHQHLPPHIEVLIVPDAQLRAFHTNLYPAGVVVRQGILRANSVLTSSGAERILLRSLKPESKKSPTS